MSGFGTAVVAFVASLAPAVAGAVSSARIDAATEQMMAGALHEEAVDRAAELLRKILDAPSGRAEGARARVLLVELHLDLRPRLDLARRWLDRATGSDLGDADRTRVRAHGDWLAGRYEESIDALCSLRARGPDDGWLSALLAMRLRELGRFRSVDGDPRPGALDVLEALDRRSPARRDVTVLLVRAYRWAREPDEARRILRRFAESWRAYDPLVEQWAEGMEARVLAFDLAEPGAAARSWRRLAASAVEAQLGAIEAGASDERLEAAVRWVDETRFMAEWAARQEEIDTRERRRTSLFAALGAVCVGVFVVSLAFAGWWLGRRTSGRAIPRKRGGERRAGAHDLR